jgi:NADPH:quinone reductase-like Zn-dependent oxidoreductase
VPNAARVADYLYGGQNNFQADRKAAQSLAAAAGHLRALIDQVLPLAEAARAHEIIEGRGGTGKVLLAP